LGIFRNNAWESSGIIPGVSTSDLAMFSDQDLTHYRISAGASYSLLNNISVFGKWKFEEYNDRAFVVHGNGSYVDSGRYQLIYVGFGYKF
jgi:opacity protein-like surface antigen